MGYTQFTINKIEGILNQFAPIRSVLDLGAQNNYSVPLLRPEDAPYISAWYSSRYISYQCIDLNEENSAIPLDLSIKHPLPPSQLGASATFLDRQKKLDDTGRIVEIFYPDLLVDAGTSEHVGHEGMFSWEAIYNCWATKYNLLKPGGIMYNENPATNNWHGHGFNYYTEAFYYQLAETHGLFKIKDIGTHPAMGNEIDGWNVYCTLQKHDNAPSFITLDEFIKLDLRQS